MLDGVITKHFIVNGWEYRTFPLVEPDNIKLVHLAVNLDTGEETSLDVSPYVELDVNEFGMMVRMGFPERKGIAPLHCEDIAKLYREDFLNVA